MPKIQANLGFWTAPPKRLSQAGDWFYPGEIAKAGVKVEKIKIKRTVPSKNSPLLRLQNFNYKENFTFFPRLYT